MTKLLKEMTSEFTSIREREMKSREATLSRSAEAKVRNGKQMSFIYFVDMFVPSLGAKGRGEEGRDGRQDFSFREVTASGGG